MNTDAIYKYSSYELNVLSIIEAPKKIAFTTKYSLYDSY